ncbi:hypothetical protein F66182_993 [Fusarium sp. NRRL 66182]|nr:hypothetical protein F66182_993 [Fusarium sp. NRRL 66182]
MMLLSTLVKSLALVVNGQYQSLSVEFFAFMEYSGNETYQNPININLVKHIRELGRVPLKVRIGGSSQGSLYWIDEQKEGMIGYYNNNADKTYNVTLGPAFLDAFDAWPSDTEFVIGLPFPPENEDYLRTNIEVTKRAHKKLGDRLLAIELGNERNDLEGYNPKIFTDRFVHYARIISQEAFGEPYARKFTAGTFHAPTLIECEDEDNAESCWSSTSLFRNGINDKGIIKYADTHQYMATFDSGTRIPRQRLMEHNHTAFFVDSHYDLAAYSTAQGVPYILGESNSLFGHGVVGTSDTFAAALWNIDYTLYSAQTNITNIGFHQAFGWRYSAWRPIPAFGHPAGVLPSYYAWWLVQKALGASNGSSKQVEAIVTDDRLTVYGVYEAGKTRGALSSLIVLNLQDWDSNKGQDSRPEVTLDFSKVAGISRKAKVYRLNAEGADSKDPGHVSFAGQYVDKLDGVIHGDELVESLDKERALRIKAAEALLVTLS